MKVLKINKSDLSVSTEMNLSVNDNATPKCLAMNNYEDAVGFGEQTISFKIESTRNIVPNINDEEYCIVMREKIDIAEIHANQSIATQVGEDFGTGNLVQERPRRPMQENKMFTELKGSNG